MKKIRNHVAMLALALGLAGGAPGSANAAVCCGVIDTGAIVAAIAAASTAITSAVTTSVTALQTTLYYAIQTATSEIRVEQNKQMGAAREIAQGQINKDTELYLKDKTIGLNRAYRAHDDVCRTVNAGEQSSRAAEVQRVEQESSVFKSTLRFMGFEDKSRADSARKALTTYAQKYCTDADVQLGRCSAPAADPAMRGAMLRIVSPADGTETYSAQEDEAAENAEKMILNPTPAPVLERGVEGTQAGKAYILGQMEDTARLSIAARTFAWGRSMRKQIDGLGSDIPGPVQRARNMSRLQLIKEQAEFRFFNRRTPEGSTWYEAVQKSSAEGLLRMLNEQMALKTYLSYENLLQNERMEQILATQLAVMVKDSSSERSAVLAEAAARQAARGAGGAAKN